MPRLLAIDYGRRRCGIAVTDPMQIVASGLTTVATGELFEFVKRYCSENEVEAIVVGNPTTMSGEPSESMRYITPGINRLAKELPEMKIIRYDERFTSTLAHRAMIDGGMKKSDRRDKAVVDRIAATIILNDYLQSRAYNSPS